MSVVDPRVRTCVRIIAGKAKEFDVIVYGIAPRELARDCTPWMRGVSRVGNIDVFDHHFISCAQHDFRATPRVYTAPEVQ